MNVFLTKRPWVSLAGVLIVGVAATGIAAASGALSTASSTNVVVTCVTNATGAIRVVSTASQCNSKKEHAVLLQAPVPTPQTEYVVDCTQGQKVQDALDAVAEVYLPVSIVITGTCSENVQVSRDDVTLSAETNGSGITAASSDGPALVIYGARNVHLYGLTISGGSGLNVGAGAVFDGDSLHLTDSTGPGLELNGGSSGTLSNATIDNNATGVAMWSAGGGTLSIWDSTITNNSNRGVSVKMGALTMGDTNVTDNGSGPNQAGVVAEEGGSIQIGGGEISGNSGNGVAAFGAGNVSIRDTLISGNQAHGGVAAQAGGSIQIANATVSGNANAGIYGYDGGHLQIWGTTIESNQGPGIDLSGGSIAEISSGTVINANQGEGLNLVDTSVARLDADTAITNNSGTAAYCGASPSVAMLHVGPGLSNVSGNGSDTIACPTLQ